MGPFTSQEFTIKTTPQLNPPKTRCGNFGGIFPGIVPENFREIAGQIREIPGIFPGNPRVVQDMFRINSVDIEFAITCEACQNTNISPYRLPEVLVKT